MRARILSPIIAAVTCAALGVGYVTLDAFDQVPGILTLQPAYGGAEHLIEPARTGPQAAKLPQPARTGRVNPQAVQALVDTMVADLATAKPDPKAAPGGAASPAPPSQPVPVHVSVEILSATDGTRLASHEPEVAYTPASSTKIPTAVAALTKLGPDHTFATQALLSGSTVVLKAGGDQLLAAGAGDPAKVRGHAGLGDLARDTAARLKARHISTVSLVLDDTLWGDQSPHPDWVRAGTTAFAGRIAPIAINTGLAHPDQTFGYVADPAAAAAVAYQKGLEANGIAVSGLDRGTTPAGAVELASVRSAPLALITRSLIKDSDNVLAEGVCRATAAAVKQPVTYAGGVSTVREIVGSLGVDMSTYEAKDCSGLSDMGKISASVLAHSLALAENPKQPHLRSLTSDLPVAGLDGTLHNRFLNTAAAGIVRAKTGSLEKARSLTGIVPTSSGDILIYSVVVADYPDGHSGQILDEMDRMVDALAAL